MGREAGIEIDHDRSELESDGVLPDTNSLCSAISSQSTKLECDLNSNEVVNRDDMTSLDSWGTVPGDWDVDGNVDFTDFVVLAHAFGGPGTYSQDDGSCDVTVDFPDFLSPSSNFGFQSDANQTQRVPEPTGLGNLFFCLCFTAGRQRLRGLTC